MPFAFLEFAPHWIFSVSPIEKLGLVAQQAETLF
jgi:hypothetical protein